MKTFFKWVAVIVSTPFVILGFFWNYISASFSVGMDLSRKFFDWMDENS